MKTQREHISLGSRLWLGGADCLITTLNNIVTGGGLTFFFVTYFGMDAKWSAACWLLFGLWNAVNDPLFGFISDKTKSKLGRRRPYIRYGGVLIALVFILAWVPMFQTGSSLQMFFQMFLSLFLFDTLYTAVATSIYVMPYEMAITNEARSRIIFIKVIFGLAALSVPLVLLAELENILSRSLREFQTVMMVIGILAGVVIFFSTFFYKENEYITHEEQYPFGKSLVTCFKNHNFLVFEVVSFTITFLNTALMVGLSYYFDSNGVNYLPCYIAMMLGIIVGMILWMGPGAKWGIKPCIVIMCLLFGTGLLVMLLLGYMTWAGVIGFFGAGIGFSGGMYVVPLMNGDVIDYDEYVSGLRREGMYAGVNSFICKPAISFANAIFPLMLGWFGYDATKALNEQSARAVFGIRFSWLFVPVLLLALCAVIIGKFYKLHGDQWEGIKERLAESHVHKQEAFEAEALQRQEEDQKK